MTYKLVFGRNSLIVPALILPAFVLIIPLLLFMEFVDPLLPRSEWIPIILSMVYFGLVIFITLQLVKATTSPVEISVMEGRIQFVFLQKNIFHRKSFTITFPEIINIGEDNDKGFDFLHFETKHMGYRKFHITAKEDDADFMAFRDYILKQEALYNAGVPNEKQITQKTLYQKWPMKSLAVLLVLFWIAYPVASHYLGTTWLNDVKYWVMVVMGTPLVMKVYYQNFRK